MANAKDKTVSQGDGAFERFLRIEASIFLGAKDWAG